MGVDDSKGNNSSIVFQAFADDLIVYQCEVLHSLIRRTRKRRLSGASSVWMVTTDGGGGVGNDNAARGNSTLTY